ncbi:uncharacterized protein LOC111312066 isoform X2 [Durio zibethinus]|uniref:Uncharacterized protein LOC111312066 isoform X2 n=1 Tax=Durio zibethinus TaxID=66656 RepID=A0A6P6ASK8_DURZI|nr:uncharacterized protein LOC111312066 isoform X2 [Durio zibethinus]
MVQLNLGKTNPRVPYPASTTKANEKPLRLRPGITKFKTPKEKSGNCEKHWSLLLVHRLALGDFRKVIMAGGNFMHRVMSYVINELVVDRLANSPAFQRFAVRTSKKIDDISNMAAKKSQELAEQMKELSKNMESKNQ